MRAILLCFLLVGGGLAGCLGPSETQSIPTDCPSESPKSLKARDTLVLAANQTYVLSLAGSGVVWGNLTLEPCEPLNLKVKVETKGKPFKPSDFAFAYLFREGQRPDVDGAIHRAWGIPRSLGSCVGNPQPDPDFIAYVIPLPPKPSPSEDRFHLVFGASAAEGTIRIQTGASGDPQDVAWLLGTNPELRLDSPEAKPILTQEFQLPPRTNRSGWITSVSPGVPAVLHAAFWHLRTSGAGAGRYWDGAAVHRGPQGEAIFQAGAEFACTFDRPGGYVVRTAIDNLDATKLLITRRYEETAARAPPWPDIGVLVLQFPFE